MMERLYFRIRSTVFKRERYRKLGSLNKNAPLLMRFPTDEDSVQNLSSKIFSISNDYLPLSVFFSSAFSEIFR
jgi:hypothetical protein